jgi:transcriptional regulator with XRE-family HTH domain
MQDKSVELYSIPHRLDRLRLKKQLTWEGVAALLKMSASMIYQVRAGKNRLSPKALYRLQDAELEAGLVSPQDSAHERAISFVSKRGSLQVRKNLAAATSKLAHKMEDHLKALPQNELLEIASFCVFRIENGSRAAEGFYKFLNTLILLEMVSRMPPEKHKT